MNGTAAKGTQMAFVDGTSSGGRSSDMMLSCKRCTHGNKVTVEFPDATFTFHAQWLHDARCDNGAARNAATAICQQPISTVHVEKASLSGNGTSMTLGVVFDDDLTSEFPGPWLRVMAPLVARSENPQLALEEEASPKGWLVDTLRIPEISYKDIFGSKEEEHSNEVIIGVMDELLGASSPGIVKIVDLPDPNFEDERNHKNNINTLVLKRLFGSVFVHPIRGSDQTFNVSSHSKDAERAVGVANYDTTQLLLPHSDHAFYDIPNQVQGFYGLEGQSENTWVSVLSALATFKEEFPDLYHHLCETPMTIGRVSRFYGDPLYQATVDTAVTSQPGFPNQTKRVRWHPNLTGALLAPYDKYKEARLAHQRFQEIMRRDTHQLKLVLKAGDLYIWDNFRLLHGRERVLQVPRTGVGQTVPEQVVHDRYRALHIDLLKQHVDEGWLIHMPMPQLREMLKFVRGYNCIDG
ncbi:hypothetical protein IMSHALPRED_001536 [Imshaugia aleurites]|uniref:TauD/TfdA-like domain-containing protein n=1 Tax=Imshaugia aleurites TaxID=172621 RepID=A0A8H3J2J1_9LECA|nr:hypothetical protein IMSHALPRED_001536 [Imshaugia aleurites]